MKRSHFKVMARLIGHLCAAFITIIGGIALLDVLGQSAMTGRGAAFACIDVKLAKIGIEGVNFNLATAIRTMVVVAMSWGMVFLTNARKGLGQISQKSWLFLILSGLATGTS